MGKAKNEDDTISEEQFTSETKDLSTSPEEDSPGDSESDAGNEFLAGMSYVPNEESDTDDADERSLLTSPVDGKSRPSKNGAQPRKEVPESSKVTSSEQPAPWLDRDSESSTH